MRGRLQDKIMFGSDYPSMPYTRILKEWQELGYSDAIMEKIMHGNAERILDVHERRQRHLEFPAVFLLDVGASTAHVRHDCQ